MLYEIICWNVASGFSYLYAWGPSRVCRDMAARGRGPHFYGASRYATNWKRAKGNCCGAAWLPHERHLPAFLWPKHCGIFHVCFKAFFSFSLDRFLPKFLFFIPFRWKDQIRSSVKIARQRFAWQGISFCYLYWNIIRFTLSPFSHLHLHLHFQLYFHLNFHFTDALLKIDSDRMRGFSIRFKSISIRFWRVTKLNLCQFQFYVSC